MTDGVTETYRNAAVGELNRSRRLGWSPEHDDRMGLDHLLQLAFKYAGQGSTVKAGAMILAARTYLQRNTKNPMQVAIEDFMTRCDQEVKKYPELPEDKIVTLRIRLMVEELLGSVSAPVEWSLDPETDHRYIRLLIQNKSDELIQSMLNGDLVGVADGLADVLYVVIGTAVAYGIDIQEVFDEVHRSNLSKTVWNEAEQRFTIEKDEFGKAIKPPTYSPADLEPIVQRQIENGKAWEAFLADTAEESELNLGKIES